MDGEVIHDLLPLAYTEEALNHVAARVNQVQDFIGRRMLLENVSTYITYKHSTMPEWEFLKEISQKTGCGLLLDINNIYVNAFNHKFNPKDFIDAIPAGMVGQFHLAGHTDMGKFLFDTHSKPVIKPVWDLYRHALKRFGAVSTLIEWDEDIPEFPELIEELNRAREIFDAEVGAKK